MCRPQGSLGSAGSAGNEIYRRRLAVWVSGGRLANVLDLPWWHWVLAVCFAVCSVGGVYAVLKLRKEWKETPPGASDMMANFRELRSQGELSDQEFRTIKTLLADELSKELNNHGKAP